MSCSIYLFKSEFLIKGFIDVLIKNNLKYFFYKCMLEITACTQITWKYMPLLPVCEHAKNCISYANSWVFPNELTI